MNIGFEITEERSSEFEDVVIKAILKETQRLKKDWKEKTHKQSIRELRDNLKCPNIYIIWVSKWEETGGETTKGVE